MESEEDTARVKAEPTDNRPDAGDDDDDSVSLNSSDIKNVETFAFYESSANYLNEVMAMQREINENVSIEFECKDVGLELPRPSTSICKSENQNLRAIVKMENENKASDIDKDVINNHRKTVHNRGKP
ncbi:hypothetical protein TKK_0000943 [Trichogramma kaykai]